MRTGCRYQDLEAPDQLQIGLIVSNVLICVSGTRVGCVGAELCRTADGAQQMKHKTSSRCGEVDVSLSDLYHASPDIPDPTA